MIPTRTTSIRITAILWLVMAAGAKANCQGEFEVPGQCSLLNPNKPAAYLKYVGESPYQKQAPKSKVLWFRLLNNLTCVVGVGATPDTLTSKYITASETIERGAVIDIIYTVDDHWYWGDIDVLLKLRPRRSVIFPVYRDDLVNGKVLAVPLSFDLNGSVVGSNSKKVYYLLNQLPKAVRY